MSLEEIGDFLSKFTEQSDHVYWISSHDMRKIQYVSASYERIWGQKREELYKNPEVWISYLHPDDVKDYHPIHEMAARIAVAGEKARYSENYRIVRPDGGIRWIMDSGFPIFDEQHNCVGVTGIAIDVTEQKEAESRVKDAESATSLANAKAVSEEEMRKTVMILVGDIVHDLRTPITTIRTVADILGMLLPILLEIVEDAQSLGSAKIKLLSQRKRAYLEDKIPITSIQNSISIIEKFINTTLIELKHAQKPHLIECPQNDLTKCSSQRIIENTIAAYPLSDHIKINQNIAYDFSLMGNSILIMKILFNLIKNAIEQIHMCGKGEITITTEESQAVNLIKVRDTAGGAAPDIVAKFFDGYFTTKKNGTGIGLAFCKNTMKTFGGDICCQSVHGEYIEFILKFPKINE